MHNKLKVSHDIKNTGLNAWKIVLTKIMHTQEFIYKTDI